MRLFGYYALHTFINQLKKLFKTWVLVFILVCALMGGVIGSFAASVTDDGGEDMDQPAAGEELAPEDGPDAGLPAGEDAALIVEAAAGAVVLAMFVFMAMGADKNGSRIFLPADVNVLFASPMRPQSVLLFRLTTQLGVSLVAGFYLLLQLPNLVGSLGMDLWSALIIVAAFCLAVLAGTLIRVLLYILAATYPRVKRYLRPGLYAVVALTAGGYLLLLREGHGYWQTALDYLGGPMGRWIPFWGWLKAACGCAAAGQPGRSALYLALTLAAGAALVWVIWHIKADFYEDAMAKSEETAELLARAQAEKTTGVLVKRKKDRSDKLRRDGMRHGAGANVYFFKAMYNRFRFAHLGLFTKTLETYLLAGLVVGLLAHSSWAVALALGVMAFFRALGNPLEQDAGMDSFLLVPERTFAKLAWSMAGVLANCLMDLLPGLILGALAAGDSVLAALAWLPAILSVNFYATAVGAFIGFSVPLSVGKTVKQLIQIMFIYFGLLPDLAAVFLAGGPAGSLLAVAAVNVVLGLIFFALTPRFLDPRPRPAAVRPGTYTAPAGAYTVPAGSPPAPGAVSPAPDMPAPLPLPEVDLAAARRRFSRLGAGALVILALSTALQLLAASVTALAFPQGETPDLVLWLITFLPLYAVAIPVGLAIWRKLPASAPEKSSLRAGQLLRCVLIAMFLLYAGNMTGNLITMALQALLGAENLNPIVDYAMNEHLWLKVPVMVVAAPLIEEYVFRKQIIDRARIYGEKLAVVLSAAVFGLFHGNLGQLFYAFALGLLFGYIYIRTGRLRYSMALHMLINLMGSVVAPAVLTAAGPDGTGLALAVYSFCLIALAIAGLVVLCVRAKHVRFLPAEQELPRGSRFRTACLNPGMIAFLLLCLASIALTLVV